MMNGRKTIDEGVVKFLKHKQSGRAEAPPKTYLLNPKCHPFPIKEGMHSNNLGSKTVTEF